MASFKLLHWTACQNCSGNNRFVVGTVENLTNESRTITVLAADSDSNDVGSVNITVGAYEESYFYVQTNLPVDYTQRVYCVGWEGSVLQFNKHVNSLYFDVEDGCKSPEAPTNVSVTCRQDGGCRIEWSTPSDRDIYIYGVKRYKNDVYEVLFETADTYLVDNTINDCNDIYSYRVYAVDKCLNTGSSSSLVTAIPYEEPCIPNWQCRTPLDGYETDINNCGEADRLNASCEASCIPNWQCEVDIDGKNTGWKIDINGCYERTYDNIMCPVGEEPPEEPSNLVFYIVAGGLGLLGLKLISKKQ